MPLCSGVWSHKLERNWICSDSYQFKVSGDSPNVPERIFWEHWLHFLDWSFCNVSTLTYSSSKDENYKFCHIYPQVAYTKPNLSPNEPYQIQITTDVHKCLVCGFGTMLQPQKLRCSEMRVMNYLIIGADDGYGFQIWTFSTQQKIFKFQSFICKTGLKCKIMA